MEPTTTTSSCSPRKDSCNKKPLSTLSTLLPFNPFEKLRCRLDLSGNTHGFSSPLTSRDDLTAPAVETDVTADDQPFVATDGATEVTSDGVTDLTTDGVTDVTTDDICHAGDVNETTTTNPMLLCQRNQTEDVDHAGVSRDHHQICPSENHAIVNGDHEETPSPVTTNVNANVTTNVTTIPFQKQQQQQKHLTFSTNGVSLHAAAAPGKSQSLGSVRSA